MSSDNDSKRCRKSRRCENCYFYHNHKENKEYVKIVVGFISNGE